MAMSTDHGHNLQTVQLLIKKNQVGLCLPRSQHALFADDGLTSVGVNIPRRCRRRSWAISPASMTSWSAARAS